MPKLIYRIIYDDDGHEMREGSKVLVNGRYERIIHFNGSGDIELEDFSSADIQTVQAMQDDRYGELEDNRVIK